MNFRELPAGADEEAGGSDVSFFVGVHDVFPEEFLTFMGLRGAAREAFLERHSDLLGVRFWLDAQRKSAPARSSTSTRIPAEARLQARLSLTVRGRGARRRTRRGPRTLTSASRRRCLGDGWSRAARLRAGRTSPRVGAGSALHRERGLHPEHLRERALHVRLAARRARDGPDRGAARGSGRSAARSRGGSPRRSSRAGGSGRADGRGSPCGGSARTAAPCPCRRRSCPSHRVPPRGAPRDARRASSWPRARKREILRR